MTDEERKALEYDDEWDMTEDEVMHRFREAVRIAKEVSRIKGEPTCEYDEKKVWLICSIPTDIENIKECCIYE